MWGGSHSGRCRVISPDLIVRCLTGPTANYRTWANGTDRWRLPCGQTSYEQRMSNTTGYVLSRLNDMFLRIPTKDAVYWFSTILAIVTKSQASKSYGVGNGHENFTRRSFLNHSFALLPSPSVGSDKPCNSVRNGWCLPWQDKINNKVVTKGYTQVVNNKFVRLHFPCHQLLLH